MRRLPLRVGAILAGAGIVLYLAALALRPQQDTDLWWLLLVGERIAADGRVPTAEFLSWWAQGSPWTVHEWAGGLALLGAYRAGGLLGTALLFLPCYALLAGATLAIARTRAAGRTRTGTLALLATLVVGANFLWTPRLLLVDAAGFALVLAALERWRLRGDRRLLATLPPYALAWSNLHGGGAILLPATIALWLAAVWLEEREGRPPVAKAPVLASLAASTGAICLNPAGPAMLVYPLATITSGPLLAWVSEWQMPEFRSVAHLGPRLLLSGLFIAAFLRDLRRERVPLAFMAAFGFLVLGALRYEPFLAIAAAAWAAPALSANLARVARRLLGRRLARALLPTVGPAVLAAWGALVLVVNLSGLALSARDPDALIGRDQPVAAVDAILDQGRLDCGRIWNTHGWGGYLAYRLRIQVASYGATDTIGDERLATYGELNSLSIDPAPVLERLRIERILVRASSPVAHWLEASRAWETRYADETAVFAVRRDGPCA